MQPEESVNAGGPSPSGGFDQTRQAPDDIVRPSKGPTVSTSPQSESALSSGVPETSRTVATAVTPEQTANGAANGSPAATSGKCSWVLGILIASLLLNAATSTAAQASGLTSYAPEIEPAGPGISIRVGNYSKIRSSGKDCEFKWGGVGGARYGLYDRAWTFKLAGGSDSWAETFVYTTYERPEGVGSWVGALDAQAPITDMLRSIYRVRSIGESVSADLAVQGRAVGQAQGRCALANDVGQPSADCRSPATEGRVCHDVRPAPMLTAKTLLRTIRSVEYACYDRGESDV